MSLCDFLTNFNVQINIARSPVLAHLNVTLQGITTVRAYKAEKMLTEIFDNNQVSKNDFNVFNLQCYVN